MQLYEHLLTFYYFKGNVRLLSRMLGVLFLETNPCDYVMLN
jgi:hypothetical protein